MIDHEIGLEIKLMQTPATTRSNRNAAVCWSLASALMFSVVLTLGAKPLFAQDTQEKPTCLPPGQLLQNPPELQSEGGILKGTIVLKHETQALPTSRNYNNNTISCEPLLLRN